MNFYEQPASAQRIIQSLLTQDGKTIAGYIGSYASVELSSLEEAQGLKPGSEQVRTIRKIQIFWAILKKAGFLPDESRLYNIAPFGRVATKFNPGFNVNLRNAAYTASNISSLPAEPNSLDELVRELGVVAKFRRDNPSHQALQSTGNSGSVFDADDIALLEFLEPQAGRSGTTLLQPYRIYHDPHAGDFVKEILEELDQGVTVILDLGNAHPTLMDYFSEILSKTVFNHQVEKFSNNDLKDHYVQLYFEEAHNLFPRKDDVRTIYSRFAKEGAKYHIGMVYSTQSPTTIGGDLLAQTENFFIAHMSSQDEVNALAKMNVAYESMKDDILRAKTPGYIRMLTRSHRFVVSVQARMFEPPVQPGTQIKMI